jgi:hypothetical protein
VEFLNRVREMMAVARNKMDSKRYEPKLQEIPEEAGTYADSNKLMVASSSAVATVYTSSSGGVMTSATMARAELSGTFGNPGFTFEASAAEIRSVMRLSKGAGADRTNTPSPV